MSWDETVNAGAVVSDLIRRDATTQPDREECLKTSTSYSFEHNEWPSLVQWKNYYVRIVEKCKASTGKDADLYGIFPEIQRAWAAFGNSLYLWDYDRGFIPHNGEWRLEQPICAVGLAKSKAGVFDDTYKFVLVVATPIKICLDILYSADYYADADRLIVKNTWVALFNTVIEQDGVAEACSVLERVGSRFYPGDLDLHLDTICLHLERAALEKNIGNEEIPKGLVGACKGAAKPVLDIYERLLSEAIIGKDLKFRLLSSVYVVLTLAGESSKEQATVSDIVELYKIRELALRYMTEAENLVPGDKLKCYFEELAKSLTT